MVCMHFLRLCHWCDLQSFQWDVQVPGEGGKWHAWLEAKNGVQSYSTPAIASTCLSRFVSILFLLCFNRFTLNWCTRKLMFFDRIVRRPGACLEIEIIKSTMAGTRARGRRCTACQDIIRKWKQWWEMEDHSQKKSVVLDAANPWTIKDLWTQGKICLVRVHKKVENTGWLCKFGEKSIK